MSRAAVRRELTGAVGADAWSVGVPSRSRRERRPGRVDVVIAGGGTGGHVVPAIAVAQALVAAGHRPERIRFVGSRRGMEARLVPEAGFAVVLLPGRGIVRRLTAKDVVRNLAALAGLAVALLEAVARLARWRPGAVVTIGGYAGAPAAVAAALLGVPVVVVNIDAVPGAANRLAARFAAACAVALPGTPLPRAVVTGVPVRPEVLALRRAGGRSPESRTAARRLLGLADCAAVVAMTGGSLGARRLNDAATGLSEALAAELDTGGGVVVYHVTGRREHERVLAAARQAAGSARAVSAALADGSAPAAGSAAAAAAGSAAVAAGCEPTPAHRIVAFEDHMPELLVACDVLVSRAGASVLAEVCVLGVPSILVPLPGAPSDHQRRNAEVLAAAGAAVLLDDADCTTEQLAAVLAPLLRQPGQLAAMAGAAAGLGKPDAAERVAALVGQAGGWR